MSPKFKCQQNLNVTKTEMLPKLKCHKIGHKNSNRNPNQIPGDRHWSPWSCFRMPSLRCLSHCQIRSNISPRQEKSQMPQKKANKLFLTVKSDNNKKKWLKLSKVAKRWQKVARDDKRWQKVFKKGKNVAKILQKIWLK